MENKDEKIFPNFDPTKDLSQAGTNRRMKRGLGAKPLMESVIQTSPIKNRRVRRCWRRDF